MSVKYSYHCQWKPKLGQRVSIETADFDTMEEAEQAARHAMAQFGYTKPRWWQWWRWGEHCSL